MYRLALVLLSAVVGISACRPRSADSEAKENWYPTDHPDIFQPNVAGTFKFHEMAMEGAVKGASFQRDQLSFNRAIAAELWNGSYWALDKGGVAQRWREGQAAGSPVVAPRMATFNPARPGSLNTLSPIEKYDLVAGNFDFKATQAEHKLIDEANNDGTPIQAWEGYCHGWAVASTREAAPTRSYEVPIKNGAGLKVRFYPDDVKALLTKFYGDYIALTSKGTGRRAVEIGMQCLVSLEDLKKPVDTVTGDPTRDEKTGRLNDLHCRDINPGSFHVVTEFFMGMTREVGDRRPYIMDAAASSQVWNYPVVGYKSRQVVPSGMNSAESAAIRDTSGGNLENNSGCKKRNELDKAAGMDRFRGNAGSGVACIIDIQTSVYYLALANPTDSTQPVAVSRMDLSYSLELNNDGYITGGEWDHQRESLAPDVARPDVLWIPKVDMSRILVDTENGTVNYSVLQEILRAGR